MCVYELVHLAFGMEEGGDFEDFEVGRVVGPVALKEEAAPSRENHAMQKERRAALGMAIVRMYDDR
jgi:hypothetical protein